MDQFLLACCHYMSEFNKRRAAEEEAHRKIKPRSKSFLRMDAVQIEDNGTVALTYQECFHGVEKESTVRFANKENCLAYMAARP